jgi:hypothetical protein
LVVVEPAALAMAVVAVVAQLYMVQLNQYHPVHTQL